MRILFAADEQPYSACALPQVARLVENTWADITLLGIAPSSRRTSVSAVAPNADQSRMTFMNSVLEDYHQKLLAYFEPTASPYLQTETDDGKNAGICKQIITRVRSGHPAREIIDEANQSGSDLVVLGCSTADGCAWTETEQVPLKVARDAACSVLVIKEDKKINKMLCCLDHDNISQKSLEMISQMLILFHSDLDIVVLTDGEDVQQKIETKLAWLIDYYSARDIFPFIELVKLASLETFVSQQARWGLMALWMGKKSILERVFPSNKVSRLLRANDSSVLLLR
jgi:nucleotide-binding universal stress UspA family protein